MSLETVEFSLICEEDLDIGSGTRQVRLQDGSLVTAHQLSLPSLLIRRTRQVQATAGQAALTVASLLVPGAKVAGVTTQNLTRLGTSQGLTGVAIGDGTLMDFWGTQTTLTAGAQTTQADFRGQSWPTYPSGGNIILSALGGLFDGQGTLEVTVHYFLLPHRQATDTANGADPAPTLALTLEDLLDVLATPAKGTLLVSDGTLWKSLPVGGDGEVLTVDSTQPLGLRWAVPTGGGGPTPSGAVNYGTTFTAQTSVSVGAATHGFTSPYLLVRVYALSGAEVLPATVTIHPTTYTVTATFAAPQSGRLVINGIGNGVPNYGTPFSGASSVTILGTAHGFGTPNLLWGVYDTAGQRVDPVSVSVDPLTFDVVGTFSTPLSGWLALSGTGQGGANYGTTFTGQTTVVIPAATHGYGTPNLLVGLYDAATPAQAIEASTLQVQPTTYTVTATFAAGQDGRLVINGSS